MPQARNDSDPLVCYRCAALSCDRWSRVPYHSSVTIAEHKHRHGGFHIYQRLGRAILHRVDPTSNSSEAMTGLGRAQVGYGVRFTTQRGHHTHYLLSVLSKSVHCARSGRALRKTHERKSPIRKLDARWLKLLRFSSPGTMQ